MKRNEITIGLFGFGCVGKGLYEVLFRTPQLKAEIKKICVKDRKKSRPIPAEHFTYDKDDILHDEEINLVVELIDDADAAYRIVTAALKQGKAVVTANKKMIAEHFKELIQLQRQYNVPLLYEAAACASIPVIRNLEEYYDNDLLEEVEGIVNGSTNYILTQTARHGITYQAALAEAQQKGYAESDPRLDTEGFDAKYKLVLLLAHAYGIIATPNQLFNLGINRLKEAELVYAKEKGWKIKLVALARKTATGKVVALVIPKFVKEHDNLYHVDDVYNAVKIRSCFSDIQFFYGKGAGAHPTASAVVSDISALTYDYRYAYKKLHPGEQLAQPYEVLLKVFLSYTATVPGQLKEYFEEVREQYSNGAGGYLIGEIYLDDLSELVAKNGSEVSVVLLDLVDGLVSKKKDSERAYEAELVSEVAGF